MGGYIHINELGEIKEPLKAILATGSAISRFRRSFVADGCSPKRRPRQGRTREKASVVPHEAEYKMDLSIVMYTMRYLSIAFVPMQIP